MTAPPEVSSEPALIVTSVPKNQYASPARAPSAMGLRAAVSCNCATSVMSCPFVCGRRLCGDARGNDVARPSLGGGDPFCIRLASIAARGDTGPMARPAWSAERLADELTRLGTRALRPEAYFDEV